MFVLWLTGWGIVIVTDSWQLLWLVPFGVLVQILNEYSVHRYVFHWPAPKHQFWFDTLYLAHYGHYDFPNKPALYFVPIWFAVPVALIHFSIAYLAFGWLGFASPVGAAGAFTFVGGASAICR